MNRRMFVGVTAIVLLLTIQMTLLAAMTTTAAKKKAKQLWGPWGTVATLERYDLSIRLKQVGVYTPGCAPKFQVFGEAESDFSLAFKDAELKDTLSGDIWIEPSQLPMGLRVSVIYANGAQDVTTVGGVGTGQFKAGFLGETGQDLVGTTTASNGVTDWHIQLEGMQSTPVKVVVDSTLAGDGRRWETPYNGGYWPVYTRWNAPRISGPFKGNVSVEGSSFDDQNLSTQQWIVDGKDYGAENTTLPFGTGAITSWRYSTFVNTAGLADGVHYVCQKITDKNGHVTRTPAILFRTDQSTGAAFAHWRPSTREFSEQELDAAPGAGEIELKAAGD